MDINEVIYFVKRFPFNDEKPIDGREGNNIGFIRTKGTRATAMVLISRVTGSPITDHSMDFGVFFGVPISMEWENIVETVSHEESIKAVSGASFASHDGGPVEIIGSELLGYHRFREEPTRLMLVLRNGKMRLVSSPRLGRESTFLLREGYHLAKELTSKMVSMADSIDMMNDCLKL